MYTCSGIVRQLTFEIISPHDNTSALTVSHRSDYCQGSQWLNCSPGYWLMQYKKLSNPFRNYYIVLRNSWFCHKVKQPSIQKHVYSTFITTVWWYNLVVWNVKPYITLTTSFSQRLRVVCNSLYIGGLFFPQHGQKSKQTPTFQYSPLCILTLSSKLSPTNSDFI